MSGQDSPQYGVEDASFKAAGGIDGIQKLVEDFYHIMESEPAAQKIRAMHPDDIAISVDKLACFLSGWLGGPRRYAAKYGALSIPGSHAHLAIGEAERDSWMMCMEKALALQSYAPDFVEYLTAQFRVPAEIVYRTSKDPVE